MAGLVWGGAIRIFVLHHVTWSINSICHVFGPPRVRVARRVAQRLVALVALVRRVVAQQPPRVPDVAFHGLRGVQIDPGRWVILALEKLGLAWKVTRIPPERQAAKALP